MYFVILIKVDQIFIMKKSMIILLFSILIFGNSCQKENIELYGYCSFSLDLKVENRVGRVYHYALEEGMKKVYCIGGIDTTASWGGFIPCNDIPKNFKPKGKVGDLVIYSGYLMSDNPDPEEPIFMGIELTKIKLASEDY
jgi:hypothetical protein